ncbi:MAG: hypothetical protein L3J41_02040 [Melioribacteraceae bacterium]|nr:hypothetical protein [Melioribacteraceae bacterium]
MRKIYIFLMLILLFNLDFVQAQSDSWAGLKDEAGQLGKEEWHPMLKYVADLHERSTHPATYPFDYEWEEIGPGYVYGPAFGHWDIVHQILDVLPSYPTHALHQLYNDVKNQEPSGLLPGSIWMIGGEDVPNMSVKRDKVDWSKKDAGHPPVWVVAVQDYIELTGDKEVLKTFYTPLVRQITWFENERKAEGEGFYYNDILIKKWESGVDQGIRFDDVDMGAWACIDATSHVYWLYKMANLWGKELGMTNDYFENRESELLQFIQEDMYSSEDGMFYDIWATKDTTLKQTAFENMWPLVVGAATQEQADRFIDDYLLNPDVFYTEHPIATVGVKDPKFELRMWRGPAWNSMTYWAARGCLNYGRKDAAAKILERALDATAKVFDETGTIWEFYHPLGGSPKDLERKPHTEYNVPCKDYLGHNPMIAMARMYEAAK